MTKIFFSHATEDKAAVEAVYSAFVARYPEHQPWVDKYEIVGGETLISKIAEGMDAADKFFIFLSPIAVTKPWVQRELRRALMREIGGVDPNFIIPVKIGDLATMPPFLEEKLYIDVPQLTKEEWLAQFDASIRGKAPRPGPGHATSNVEIIARYAESSNIARIAFSARAWAEEFSYAVVASDEIERCYVEGGGLFMGPNHANEGGVAGVRFASPQLRPGKPIALRVHFAEGVDALESIQKVARWEPN